MNNTRVARVLAAGLFSIQGNSRAAEAAAAAARVVVAHYFYTTKINLVCRRGKDTPAAKERDGVYIVAEKNARGKREARAEEGGETVSRYYTPRSSFSCLPIAALPENEIKTLLRLLLFLACI